VEPDWSTVLGDDLTPDIRATAEAKNINSLFLGKVFRVPDYQRNYAWIEKNWEDLWNDIKDGLSSWLSDRSSTGSEHYLGTITLMNTKEEKYVEERVTPFAIYDIVDGQQRIATIYLILIALSNMGKRDAIKESFIKCGNLYRLELGGLNNDFLKAIVDGKESQAEIRTNKLLKNALEYFENQMKAFGNADKVLEYLLTRMVCLEFVVDNEILAIKAFESLNDRGKPLTLLDKTKSFLRFVSSEYLNNRLNAEINRIFGSLFTNFDLVKELAEKEEIDYIKSDRFSEDEILRLCYHYFAYYADVKFDLPRAYDYRVSLEDVFAIFLKEACNHLRNTPDRLSYFMEELLRSLDKVVIALKNIVQKVGTDWGYKRLFSFLGPNAAIYPLLVSLDAEELLDQRILSAVETLDLKVYQVASGQPRADLYRDLVIKIKPGLQSSQAYESIKNFVNAYMSDTRFEYVLDNDVYGNDAVKYILWEYEKHEDPSFNDHDFDLYKEVTIEHIFPQTETESFPGEGFESKEEYVLNLNRFGNLTLLERKLNSQATNLIPKLKSKFYRRSRMPRTKKLGYIIDNFTKKDINKTTRDIVDFCLTRWKL
jgi:uncharacterized protein with ParB-like and HNH nuclease domain